MGSVGSRLRAARQRLGLTQPEVADLVGVSKTTVSTWETNLHPPTRYLGKLLEVLQLDERFEPLGPGSPPDRYDFYNMDDQQLAARMTALLAELTALTAEVTLRLGASDTRGRAETPAQTGRAQPPARTGRYDYVITMEDLERLEADGGKSDDGRSSTG